MRSVVFLLCLSLFASMAVAQSDRGTITGTVADPAGAVVPNVPIEARNSETGAVYQVTTTATGNYTLAQLPAGVYQLSASIPGFKQYVRTGITVMVAQTLRIDIVLEVGNIAETVTVSADAPLLKTESGEMSHNVTSDRLESLPILNASAGLRNPYAVTQLIAGTTWVPNAVVRVNGAPGNTQSLRIEGQDATNGLWSTTQGMTQPSVDSIEEFAIQTSNFAAEYGQAGGGVFNVTMRSGGNQIHGSAYEYFVNEAFNASQNYINAKPRDRRHDFGFTFGGPVYIPGIYDGHDKTFFFFNFEQNRRNQIVNNVPATVPTEAFRNGDFSSLITGRVLNTDPFGNPIIEGTIYDPATERIYNGKVVRDPFPGNMISPDRFDPVAVKIQALIPAPTNNLPTNNIIPVYSSPSTQTPISLKMDHFLSPKIKLSGYWSMLRIRTPSPDGFPSPITVQRPSIQDSNTGRLNLDLTLSPNLLLHIGTGLLHLSFIDDVPDTHYDVLKELGLKGTYVTKFPYITGLQTAQGGMRTMGPTAQSHDIFLKPTANTSVTWVRNNHTYKFGAEMRLEGYPFELSTPANGFFNFQAIETGLPSTQGQDLKGGFIGFPYASFLLGMVNNGEIGLVSNTRVGKNNWAIFAQDSWKVTRKLTLDYGLRWDYETYLKEQYGRLPSLGLTTPNPTAGNLPGGVIFEATSGDFAKNYKYGFGPRLGLAYQITPKTVFRAGWGISYGQTAQNNFWSLRFGSRVAYSAPSYGTPATLLKDGVPIVPVWPNFDPGQFPPLGIPTTFLTRIDPNAGRPPRMNMWSIGLQRELTANMALEVSYVGNRGVWWSSDSMIDINRITPQILSNHGLDLNNQQDRELLASRLNSTTAISRGFNNPPYAGFPLTSTVAQSLRPFPQFTAINTLWAPLGNTWYDSMQVKFTKRYSYGLDFTTAFSWQKEMTVGAETEDPAFAFVTPSVNDVLDRQSNKYLSGFSQPLRIVIAANYTLPKLNTNKMLSWAIRDWTFGAVLQYASGRPIRVPYASSNQLQTILALCSPVNVFGSCQGTGTFANRVPGEPLFTQDLNSKFDPNTTFVLNSNAWVDPAPGQFGSSAAYYSDYRYARQPSEDFSFGRLFRFREGMSLQIRIELTNLFNRTFMSNPSSSNAGQTQLMNSAGKPLSGFGYINTGSVASRPRSGQLVMQFKF